MLDVPQQISIEEALLECEREQLLADAAGAPVELERLGESPGFGWLLIELLEKQGWLVHLTSPFAGTIDDEGTRGILVVAAHPDVGLPIELTGRTVADCATPLVIEASKHIRTIANAARRRAEISDKPTGGSGAACDAREGDRRRDADDLSAAGPR